MDQCRSSLLGGSCWDPFLTITYPGHCARLSKPPEPFYVHGYVSGPDANLTAYLEAARNEHWDQGAGKVVSKPGTIVRGTLANYMPNVFGSAFDWTFRFDGRLPRKRLLNLVVEASIEGRLLREMRF